MQLDDEGLLTLVRGELKRLVGVVAEPAFHRIHRWFSGSPQYDVGHLARVEQIDASLPSGVFVTGSAYRGVGLPDIVYAAQATTVEVLRHLGTRSESIEQKTTESAIWS